MRKRQQDLQAERIDQLLPLGSITAIDNVTTDAFLLADRLRKLIAGSCQFIQDTSKNSLLRIIFRSKLSIAFSLQSLRIRYITKLQGEIIEVICTEEVIKTQINGLTGSIRFLL